ncbi:MAG: enoyl-CoA hydratase [Rhodoferax sp.]|nr:enoyl-CoA hydratase [Rhodoferax sp.]
MTRFVTHKIEVAAVGVITIARPERRNALNLAVKRELIDSLGALDADPTVRVIIITGAGGYFVAGTDIAEMMGMTPTGHTLEASDAVFTALRRSPKVLIAAIEGYALGGGCELALCCDMIVAATTAKLGQPEIKVGIMPGAGATQRLLRTVGRYQAMRLLLSGEAIGASEAYGMGLVSELAPEGEALQRALALAAGVAAMPPLAVRSIKEVVLMGQDAPMETALLLERKAFQLLFDSADQREGMAAFMEKRAPAYLGC